jgi:hypothetical protein
MNLRSWNNNVVGAINKIAAATIIFRQNRPNGLLSPSHMISLPIRVQNVVAALVWALALALTSAASAQTNYYTTNGTEYAVIGNLLGDQVLPDAAISTNGGFVVWQDNITDGSGWGISARRLDDTLSGTLGTFRVNVTGTNDQENPRVTVLKNGGAAFVWQGGIEGYQHIFARFLTPANTFLTTTDLVVSKFTSNFQINPAIATLNNSNVVIVWSSYDQVTTNSQMDIYAKILSPTGTTVSNEFLINQFTNYNQRTPAIAALKNGGFIVTWVSEQQQIPSAPLGNNTNIYYSVSGAPVPSVNIYARLYKTNGAPVGNEFPVDAGSNPCANPRVAAATDGTFMIAWSARDVLTANGWDVYARPFSNAGVGGSVVRLNTYVNGDQYAPRLSAIGLDYLTTWTSLGQDGSREGVYGQFIHSDGSLVGGELLVNTTTLSQQIQPVVASDGVDQFLTVWAGYSGNPYSFDLFAQRYINVSAVLNALSAPFVYAPFTLSNNVYQPQLQVSWPSLLGISVSNFEVYVDGAATPMATVTTNQWTMTALNGLTTNDTHSFQVAYVTAAGNRSPLSSATSGTTWSGLNWGGIPYEWMAMYYGGYINGFYYTTAWPVAGSRIGSGTLQNIYVTGGNPFDASTWLQMKTTPTAQGMFINWNTQPGATYQVQVTTNFTSWSNVGSPRFAAGTTDSMYVGGNAAGYYRVMVLRQ